MAATVNPFLVSSSDFGQSSQHYDRTAFPKAFERGHALLSTLESIAECTPEKQVRARVVCLCLELPRRGFYRNFSKVKAVKNMHGAHAK